MQKQLIELQKQLAASLAANKALQSPQTPQTSVIITKPQPAPSQQAPTQLESAVSSNLQEPNVSSNIKNFK